jgi:hypothetical protein
MHISLGEVLWGTLVYKVGWGTMGFVSENLGRAKKLRFFFFGFSSITGLFFIMGFQ